MIYFDLRFNNPTKPLTSTVSIRKMALPAQGFGQVYAYEITSGSKRHRGTVTHEGPEDFALVSAVLNDYVGSHDR
jgi:hypothetical protein